MIIIIDQYHDQFTMGGSEKQGVATDGQVHHGCREQFPDFCFCVTPFKCVTNDKEKVEM